MKTNHISTFSSLTSLNNEIHARLRKIGVGAGTSHVTTETMFIRASIVAATTAVSFTDNIRSDKRRKLEKRRSLTVGMPCGAVVAFSNGVCNKYISVALVLYGDIDTCEIRCIIHPRSLKRLHFSRASSTVIFPVSYLHVSFVDLQDFADVAFRARTI
ncbi:hypothetical protein ALC57_10867 [Trachymyrmex cornetzi]|uniref:Uncharacterized protein n=1 Tax=Trachymyrmex cornetzi TaxID=471704 RepID=A0A195DVI4_9HYME|nr:hypothetical protein ALC57_10867 [Trachymyrmex cornetzi]